MPVTMHSNSWLPKLLGVGAITLGQHIFFSAKEPGHSIIEHELAHTRQYQTVGKLRFWTRYLAEYVSYRINGLSHTEAYGSISFEREARAAVRVSAARRARIAREQMG